MLHVTIEAISRRGLYNRIVLNEISDSYRSVLWTLGLAFSSVLNNFYNLQGGSMNDLR
jgi:hypothetical protein